jgi:hypothetical protein
MNIDLDRSGGFETRLRFSHDPKTGRLQTESCDLPNELFDCPPLWQQDISQRHSEPVALSRDRSRRNSWTIDLAVLKRWNRGLSRIQLKDAPIGDPCDLDQRSIRRVRARRDSHIENTS